MSGQMFEATTEALYQRLAELSRARMALDAQIDAVCRRLAERDAEAAGLPVPERHLRPVPLPAVVELQTRVEDDAAYIREVTR